VTLFHGKLHASEREFLLDFQQVASTLLRDFEQADVHYALIGGFALSLWGASRSTVDMDFLLLVDDIAHTESILGKYHYRCIHKTKNVGQYVSSDSNYGSLDFIYASRSISKKMLARCVDTGFGPKTTVKVLLPEDIIGLKVQALVNDPSRLIKDYADIDALLKARNADSAKIDWQLLKEYFELFDKLTLYEQLVESHGTSN